jgi:hypothetical protein
MNKCRASLILMMGLVVMLGACGPRPAITPTPTVTPSPVPTPTVTPSPVPTPEPLTVRVVGYEDVRTIQLVVEQSYPEIQGKSAEPIAETCGRILMEAGLQVVDETAVHYDATLTITLTGEALGTNYTMGRYCYSGAKVKGQAVLSAPTSEPFEILVSEEDPCPYTISHCPGPLEAPFEKVWSRAILNALARLWGPSPLIIALEDEDWHVREAAAIVLGHIGPEAKEAVPALIEALQDEEWDVRHAALGALGEIGPEAKEAVPALIKALRDEHPYTRQDAALALGSIGAEAKEAIPALIEALEDNDEYGRQDAALALGSIGVEAKEAVPALIKALGDEKPCARAAAAWALGSIGAEVKETVPALIEALRDEDSLVRQNATEALGAITGQDFGQDALRWQEWWKEQK